MRIVEEVALDAPDFVVHLLPLGARVHVNFHVRQLERPGIRLGRLAGGRDAPLLALFVQHLLAVGGDDAMR